MADDASAGIRTYDGAVALISGGASGIGAALSRALVAKGARVVLADRQPDLAKQVAEGLGEKARAVQLDVREADAYRAVAAGVIEQEGRIDYFFNNAGIGIGGLFEDHDLDDWRYAVDVNLMGVVYGISAVYPVLLEQGFGHIVNTASMAGRVATPGLSAYCATKHAVVGLSRSLRIEAAGRGVRVSAFCPGVIRTEILNDGGVYGKFVGGISGDLDEERLERARPMDVDAFAKAALACVARNEEVIVLPKRWKYFDLVYRFIPGLLGKWMASQFFKEYERMAQERKSSG